YLTENEALLSAPDSPRRRAPCRTGRSSIVKLSADPEEVVVAAVEVFRGVEEDGRPVGRVLPVEVDLDVAGEIPVQAHVDQVDAPGPAVRVGDAGREDRLPQAELAVAREYFEGPRPPRAVGRIERASRTDHPAFR